MSSLWKDCTDSTRERSAIKSSLEDEKNGYSCRDMLTKACFDWLKLVIPFYIGLVRSRCWGFCNTRRGITRSHI